MNDKLTKSQKLIHQFFPASNNLNLNIKESQSQYNRSTAKITMSGRHRRRSETVDGSPDFLFLQPSTEVATGFQLGRELRRRPVEQCRNGLIMGSTSHVARQPTTGIRVERTKLCSE